MAQYEILDTLNKFMETQRNHNSVRGLTVLEISLLTGIQNKNTLAVNLRQLTKYGLLDKQIVHIGTNKPLTLYKASIKK